MTMTDDEREMWVTNLAKQLGLEFSVKYMRGRREHGCDLGSVPLEKLLIESRNESLDQISYVSEMHRRFIILAAHIEGLEKLLVEKQLEIDRLVTLAQTAVKV